MRDGRGEKREGGKGRMRVFGVEEGEVLNVRG